MPGLRARAKGMGTGWTYPYFEYIKDGNGFVRQESGFGKNTIKKTLN